MGKKFLFLLLLCPAFILSQTNDRTITLSGSGGGSGSDTNFAITNLTFTGARTHDGAGFDLTLSNFNDINFEASTNQKFFMSSNLFGVGVEGVGLVRSGATFFDWHGHLSYMAAGSQVSVIGEAEGSTFYGLYYEDSGVTKRNILRSENLSLDIPSAATEPNNSPLVKLTTTGDAVWGPFALPSTAPPAGNYVIEWINGTPNFISTPTGGGASDGNGLFSLSNQSGTFQVSAATMAGTGLTINGASSTFEINTLNQLTFTTNFVTLTVANNYGNTVSGDYTLSTPSGTSNLQITSGNLLRIGAANSMEVEPHNNGSAPTRALFMKDISGSSDGWSLYSFPATGPGSGNQIIQWNNGTPSFVSTPTGGSSDGNGLFDVANNSGTFAVTAATLGTGGLSISGASQNLSFTGVDTYTNSATNVGITSATTFSLVTPNDASSVSGAPLLRNVSGTFEDWATYALPVSPPGTGNFVIEWVNNVPSFIATPSVGASLTVIASNGLTDADAGSNVDVELGGSLSQATTINMNNNDFTINNQASVTGTSLTFSGTTTTLTSDHRVFIGDQDETDVYLDIDGNGAATNGEVYFVLNDLAFPGSGSSADAQVGSLIQLRDITGTEKGRIHYTDYGFPINGPTTFSTPYSMLTHASDLTQPMVFFDMVNGTKSGLSFFANTVTNQMDYYLGGSLTANAEVEVGTFHFIARHSASGAGDETQYGVYVNRSGTVGGGAVASLTYLDAPTGTVGIAHDRSWAQVTDTHAEIAYFNNDGLGGSVMDAVRVGENGVQLFVNNVARITIDQNEKILINNALPQYLNDTAADLDGTLPSGGLYQVTGTREIRRKP